MGSSVQAEIQRFDQGLASVGKKETDAKRLLSATVQKHHLPSCPRPDAGQQFAVRETGTG